MLITIEVSELVNNAVGAQEAGNDELALKEFQKLEIFDYENPGTPENIQINLDGYNDWEKAEICLSIGRHYGFYGITKRDAQELSKNLITRAREFFSQDAKYFRQLLVCYNYQALTDSRVGTLSEAELWLKYAHNQIDENEFEFDDSDRLHTFIVESIVNRRGGKPDVVLEHLNAEQQSFDSCKNLYLSGLFYMNRGLAKENLNKMRSALEDHIKAQDIFRQLGNEKLFAYSENNIALCYKKLGKIDKAFEYAEKSFESAKNVEDIRLQGCVKETITQLLVEKGKYEKAIECINESIELLEQTECHWYRLQSFKTKMEILLKIENIEEALPLYSAALQLAQTYCSPADAERLTLTLGKFIRERAVTTFVEKEAVCRLVFANGYTPNGTVRRIQITTNRHAHLNLRIGHFAIVEKMPIKNGEFGAIVNNGEYYLGFIESFTGMVTIEFGNQKQEPKLFDESEVEILGKVIGYCTGKQETDATYLVLPFNL